MDLIEGSGETGRCERVPDMTLSKLRSTPGGVVLSVEGVGTGAGRCAHIETVS